MQTIKLIWMATIFVAVVAMESRASAQFFVRRNTTRPCPTWGLPSVNYQFDVRSPSVTAISDRFVYFDDLMDVVNLPSNENSPKTTVVTTVTTEKDVSKKTKVGRANAVGSGNDRSPIGSNLNDTSETPAEIIPNDDVLVSAEGQLLTPGKVSDKTTTIIESYNSSPGSEQATIARDKKLFQWRQDTIQIDHCAISELAVQLSRDGVWVLNLRADQNRKVADNRFNPTLHIRRNNFGLVLRCYGNMDSMPRSIALKAGRPVLAEIEVDPFWVQNGVPEFVVETKSDNSIGKHFDLIDRVEVEFFYYK